MKLSEEIMKLEGLRFKTYLKIDKCVSIYELINLRKEIDKINEKIKELNEKILSERDK